MRAAIAVVLGLIAAACGASSAAATLAEPVAPRQRSQAPLVLVCGVNVECERVQR